MSLAVDTVLPVPGGGRLRVVRELGRGGQGIVYEVLDQDQQSFALKWYARPQRGQHDAIADLLDRGAPSDRFLWPTAIVYASDSAQYGYVMPLRPEPFVGIRRLLDPTDQVQITFPAAIRLCHQLARSFQKLHARGLCYRDINLGNIFVDATTGDVLICDNDNVGIEGSPGRVLGVPDFMAPEVLLLYVCDRLRRGSIDPERGDGLQRQLDPLLGLPPGPAWPSIRTDLHSLAVLLFMLLLEAHPLRGRKAVGPVEFGWYFEHYCRDPVFVFDPHDECNRPDEPHVEDRWRRLPNELQRLFTAAFTEGIRRPDARILEGQWTKAFLRVRDAVTECACGVTIFDGGDRAVRCPACGTLVPPAPRLSVGDRDLVIAPGSILWSDLLHGDPDRATPVGQIVAHPRDPRRLGLRNSTSGTWHAIDAAGGVHDVGPGRAVQLRAGTRILIGGVQAEVAGSTP
jgi:eukaryotic-like serine/threonine-protein kinase